MSFGNEKKLNKELPVVLSQQLAEGRYQMTLPERRLVYVAMSKITPNDMEFGTVRFTKTEYIALLEDCGVYIKSGRFEEELIEACDGLLQRIVRIYDGNSWTAWQWMSRARYTADTETVELRFHEEMEPFLLYLADNKGYTKFLLKFAMPIQSPYAIRLYELLRGKVWDQSPVMRHKMTIDEIRQLMLLEDKYKRYGHLKKRVIDQALKEINGKTDLSVSMRQNRAKKRGAPIQSITFLVNLLPPGATKPWHKYLLYAEDDIDDEIILFVKQETGKTIGVAKNTPNSELRKHAKARIYYELVNREHDLSKINHPEAFIAYLIADYAQDDLTINQLSLFNRD